MKFLKPYQKQPRTYSPSGEAIVEQFELEIDPVTKAEKLVKIGEVNNYELIQSYRNEANLKFLLDKLTRQGENPLDQSQDDFNINEIPLNDYTDLPDNLTEAQDVRNRLERAWYKLPLSTKLMFGNKFDNYMTGKIDKAWAKDYELQELKKKGKEDEELIKENKGAND